MSLLHTAESSQEFFFEEEFITGAFSILIVIIISHEPVGPDKVECESDLFCQSRDSGSPASTGEPHRGKSDSE